MSKSWKDKYAEVYHGKFVYEDFAGWIEHSNRKLIPLLLTSSRCRALKSHSSNGHYAFEITEIGGIQRVWSATTPEERSIWIDAINTASLGSGGEFGYDSTTCAIGYCGTPIIPSKRSTQEDSSEYDHSRHGAGGGEKVPLDMLSTASSDVSRSQLQGQNNNSGQTNQHSTRFYHIMSTIQDSNSTEEYKLRLTAASSGGLLMIPVYLVKVKYYLINTYIMTLPLHNLLVYTYADVSMCRCTCLTCGSWCGVV